MGRKKPLFFFFKFSLLFFVISAVAFFCLFNKSHYVLSQKNFFDKNQYFFPKTVKTAEIIDFNVSEGVFLTHSGPPFLISARSFASLDDFSGDQEVFNYIVEPGDTIVSLAEKFNISPETIFWANNLSKSSIIKPGDKLAILPITGVLHFVAPGDTLSGLVNIYKADPAKIIEINGLSEQGAVFAGDMLIIPGGIKPKTSYNFVQVPLPGNYFICPIPWPCRITQGLHWYNAVDFSNNKCGEPVFAAAGGIVQKTGLGTVSGNYVRIEHSNSVITFYGHLSKIAVSSGERVSQGQIIGYVGYTGKTIPAGPTGCHLHFDVRFAKNPFSIYNAGVQLGK